MKKRRVSDKRRVPNKRLDIVQFVDWLWTDIWLLLSSRHVLKYGILAYMQNRVPNSQRYLVNAKPDTNHSTNPTNPNGNSKR